jgi:hypothetical protein
MLRPMRWIAPTLIVGLVALHYPGHADAESPSVLLGRWHLVAEQPNPAAPAAHCTITDILFEPNTQTWVDGGQTSRVRVLGYDMSGDDVHVVTGTVDAYKIINHDKITYQDVRAGCTYSRVR